MKTAEALDYYKSSAKTGRSALAEALTDGGWPITTSAISLWGEHPPIGRQFQIEQLTKGDLKATPKDQQGGNHAA